MFVSLQTMRIMKKALDMAGLSPYLMVQPIAYFCPDAGRQGIIDLPEFPFALEPRISTRSAHNIRLLTRSTMILYCLSVDVIIILIVNLKLRRFDMNKFAREAYNLGVRYIGGCCGFQAYHIRAVAEELAEERGKSPAGSEKHIPWAGGLRMHTKPWVRARASRYNWRSCSNGFRSSDIQLSKTLTDIDDDQ